MVGTTWQARFYHPEPLELASGTVTGLLDGTDPVKEWASQLAPGDTPRKVLEETLLGALRRSPCVLGFSGGRDSSGLLALAATVARREGLPLPVALTYRYDNEAETEESSWQELVIDHLGIADWEKVRVGTANDVIGELAQPFLLRHGLVFPSMLYNNTLLLDKARGGSHMTGEGGDEVFGLRRATILRRVANNPKYLLSFPYLKLAALVLGPRATRVAAQYHVNRKALDSSLKHLRPGLAEEVTRRVSEHLASEPFDNSKSLAWHLRRRGAVFYQQAITAFSLEYEVYHVDPFLEPRFVASYARTVGPFGLATRSDAMRLLFSDVLPEQILTRSSKALFNRGFLTDVGRAFASTWGGGGVDTELVDVDALRAAWLSHWPPVQTFWLLQAAWLHENQPAEVRLT